MKKDISNKGKHLTRDNREYIEAALNEGHPLIEIAKKLEKDPTTISKEIKRNRIVTSRNKQSDIISCSTKKDCTRKHICHSSCDHLCKKCKTLKNHRCLSPNKLTSEAPDTVNSLPKLIHQSFYPYFL